MPTLILALLLCMNAAAAQTASDDGAPDEPALVVRLIQAELRPDIHAFSLTGYIAARNTLTASFPSAGRVSSISVIEGDRVEAGMELARIESVAQEQALRAKEAGLTSATASLAQAQSDFNRQDALLARGSTTRTVRDTAENVLISAEATVAEAQAELDLARKDLEDTVLRAPADGIVTSRDAEVGQVVAAAQGVVGLAIGGAFDAVIGVPEVRLSVPRNPGTVSLELLEGTAPAFEGKVREILPVIDSATGTVQVKISVIDPPPDIAIGAAVRTNVAYTDSPVVALPSSALTATATGLAVWVVDPDTFKVHLRQVQVLRHETATVLLNAGVQDGEIVVGAGSQLLYEGRTVKDAAPVTEQD
ncbi:MAG: efflux RND transporter periplasmic adaptor subunit, partial [Jannaschia sp.]